MPASQHARTDLSTDLPPDLVALSAQVKNPVHGFFGPGSMSWRIARESVLFFGGHRALLLQLAHPHVGQGVAEHSNFQSEPIARAIRTFDIVARILFGTRDTALRAAMKTRAIHGTVKGKLPDTAGEFAAGSRYHANRGDLLFWVHATLVESAIYAYELLAEPLSVHEKDRYYEEAKTFARLFGTPTKAIPPTYADFRDYFDEMVDQKLAVSPAALELSKALMAGPFYLRGLKPVNVYITAGSLPPRIRQAYHLPWDPVRALIFNQTVRTVRFTRRRLPRALRYTPFYHQGMRRIRSIG